MAHVLMNDNVARKLFKNSKVGKELTARIVSNLLKEDFETVYKNIKLVSEDVAFSALTIDSRTDMMLEDNSMYVDIEICYTKGSTRRIQTDSYCYQIYLRQLKSYKDYKNIKKVIQILIEDYDFFGKNEFIYDVVFMEKNLHLQEDELLEKYHVNIDYLNKLGYNEIRSEDLFKLLYFLTCDDRNKLEEVYKGDKFMSDVIKEAKEIADDDHIKLFFTEEEVRRLDGEERYEAGLKDGIQEGIKQGIEQGIEQRNQEMVINMYNDKVSIETIAKYANLTTEEVQKIIDEE